MIELALRHVALRTVSFVLGHFKEKASILHKMAKKKCKEDGATANGVGVYQ